MNDTKKENSDSQTKTGVWPLIKGVPGEGGQKEERKEDQVGKEAGSGSSEEKPKKQD